MGADPISPATQDLARGKAWCDALAELALFLIGPDGAILHANPGARALFGASAQSWPERARLHDPDHKTPMPPLRELLSSPAGAPLRVGWLGDAGTEHVLDIRQASIDGSDLSLVSVHDITGDWLRGATISVAQSDTATAPSITDLSHKLSNIFGILQIAAERLQNLDQDLPLPPSAQATLADIQGAALRGSALLRDMHWHDATNRPPTDATLVFRESASLAQRILPAGAQLSLEVSDDPVWVVCPSADYEEACLALFAQARAVCLDHGSGAIRASLSQQAGDAVLTVTLQHGAIPLPDALPRPDPFVNAELSRSGTIGRILSLEALARRQHGSFDVLNRPQGGVTLTLRLPAASEPAAALTTAPLPIGDLSGYRILLTDADAALRDLLAETLRSAGAQVATAGTAEATLHALSHETGPDVLICGVELTDGTPLGTLRQLMVEANVACRIILMTGQSDIDRLPPGKDLPGLLLRKPVSPNALAQAIRLQPPDPRDGAP